MEYGYARCSTNESKQEINRQVRELKQAGAESIFLEYEHGDAVGKCQLYSLLDQAAEGDTIITLEVSRLARSTKQLCEIIEVIRAKRLRLVIVGSITVDCSNGEIDPMTNAFIQMSGVFAELELRIIRERVRSGMANAKAKGIRVGRPPLSKEEIPQVFSVPPTTFISSSFSSNKRPTIAAGTQATIIFPQSEKISGLIRLF